MRYRTARKYPITEMKKYEQAKKRDHGIEFSIGAAACILAAVFIKGLLWGFMIRKRS